MRNLDVFSMDQKVIRTSAKRIHADMTVKEVLAAHPEAGLVLANYHLGGCSHCSINEVEKIYEVCEGYGIPLDVLLASLNNLFEDFE